MRCRWKLLGQQLLSEAPRLLEEQVVFFCCLVLYHKSPDSGESQYTSST